MSQYIFKTERLGFRAWKQKDILPMSEINADPEVMKFFPSTQDLRTTQQKILLFDMQLDIHGFTFYAVELRKGSRFIGFIGLYKADFQADFTPCVEIGWRLAKDVWNQGLATEGAKACLDYAFNELGINEVYSFTPTINLASERVMEKIGMTKEGEFDHPKVAKESGIQRHVLYKISK